MYRCLRLTQWPRSIQDIPAHVCELIFRKGGIVMGLVEGVEEMVQDFASEVGLQMVGRFIQGGGSRKKRQPGQGVTFQRISGISVRQFALVGQNLGADFAILAACTIVGIHLKTVFALMKAAVRDPCTTLVFDVGEMARAMQGQDVHRTMKLQVLAKALSLPRFRAHSGAEDAHTTVLAFLEIARLTREARARGV
ncbi:hypothetical protein M427DRAFT_133648 [Gonapodya prolifera JEL478]|uniref:Exonuclease domain-containing protein n=1 Tax=Gonapodya prolifera (strain JEL478) TaxID=1344416 RepID=A0A139AK96_GONPJ|nr:hypothetical protein M427DRAFT_133648 [Gonapodya prolifera JEL478]|eukprot:KXS17212.1 hypothetical protein M427DRAFT_133648 [Gonapodya prolifera JEL478]